MALSQADFYAYSRATGVPVPKTPEEQAELAPQVLDFRRNQLRAPSQEPSKGFDPVSVGIGVGLALAGGVGAGLGIRRLMKGPKKSATAGVRQADLSKLAAQSDVVRQVASTEVPVSRVATTEVAPSRPAPTASAPVATATPDQPSIDAWERKSFSPRSYLEETGSLAPQDLTSVQQQNLPQVIEQKIEAVDSGANQQQIRTAATVQRNEDLDIPFVQEFLQNERNEIASQMGELGLKNPGLIEKELANRIGPNSYEYGSQYTKVKQLMELGLQDPAFLQSPIAPQKIRVGGGEFPIQTKNVMADEPGLAFKKPYISETTAISSEQSFVNAQNEIKDWLGNIRLEVEPQINKLTKVQADLGEQQNMLLNVLNQKPDPELAKQFQYVSNQLKENEKQLSLLNNRLSGARSKANELLQDVSKWTPETLTDWSGEGTVVRPKRQAPAEFVFDDGDPVSFIENVAQPGTSTITQEDFEIVPGGLLTGGRARVVENLGIDPFSGEEILVRTAGKREPTAPSVRGRGGTAGLATQSSIGIYGLEPSEYGTSAQTKVGEYTQQASQVPTLVEGEPVPRTTGGFFKYPQQREADPTKYTNVPTQQSRESFDIARQLRQLQISGKPGEAQAFLDKMMKQRGVSGTAGTYSPLK